jgi:hypothetical protein
MTRESLIVVRRWRRAVTAAALGGLAVSSAPASCVDYLDADAGAPRADGGMPNDAEGARLDGGGDGAPLGADGATPGGDGGCDYACVVLRDRPVLYLRFEEEGSTTEAHDSSPSGCNGQYPQAGATKGAASVVPGHAVGFTGDGPQQIAMPPSLDFTGTNITFSVELWEKPDSVTGFQFLIDHERFDNRGGWIVENQDGNVQLELWQNNAAFAVGYTSGAPLKVGAWHHVVVTYNGSDGMTFVWINRKLEFAKITRAGANLPSIGPWSIGKQNCTPCLGTNFAGTIDELAVYDHLLDQATVDAHYRAAGLN